MTRWHSALVLAICVGTVNVSTIGWAQGYGRKREVHPYTTSPPVVSPYLNLLRPGGTPFENYFLHTQPQLRQREENARQAIATQRLRRDLGSLESRAVQGHFAAPSIRPTGAAAQFQTHRSYFKTR
jgi:hypothetical protein